MTDRFAADKTAAFREMVAAMTPDEIDELNQHRRRLAWRQNQRRGWKRRDGEIVAPVVPGGSDAD